MEVLESSGLSSRSRGWDQDAAQRQGSRISSWDPEPSGFMVGLAVEGCLGEGAGRQPVVLNRGIPWKPQESRDMGEFRFREGGVGSGQKRPERHLDQDSVLQ